MEKEQLIQEKQYHFPYHHLVREGNGKFSQIQQLRWGYIYLSYLSYVLEYLKHHSFKTLLDVGCGDGKFLYEAQQHFSNSKILEGIDYSAHAILFAKAFTPEVIFHTADITNPKVLPKQYDVITFIETLEHIPPNKIDTFLKALSERLTESGILILTVPSDNVKVSLKHYQHFSLETLRKTLHPYFTIEKSNFLNKKSARQHIIATLFSNRFFILNQQRLINLLFRYYTKHLLLANEKNGKRIFAVCKKNIT